MGRVVQCLPFSPAKAHEVEPCPPELDPEAYQRLVVTARSVAVARPCNLVRFADAHETTLVAADLGKFDFLRLLLLLIIYSPTPPKGVKRVDHP